MTDGIGQATLVHELAPPGCRGIWTTFSWRLAMDQDKGSDGAKLPKTDEYEYEYEYLKLATADSSVMEIVT